MTNPNQAIFEEAVAAGQAAAQKYNESLGDENARGFDCGFAWVTVRPARGPFVKWCKENSHGSSAYGGSWQFWYSVFSDRTTQSVSVHEVGATAFAAVLIKHGIVAAVGSRLD